MRKYLLSPNGTIPERHPSIWLWLTVSLLVSCWVQLLLGTDRLIVRISLFIESCILLAFMEKTEKPLTVILAYAILTFFFNGGIEYTGQCFDAYCSRNPDPIVENSPTPDDHIPILEEIDWIPIREFFDKDVVREIPWTKKTLPIGTNDYTLIFAESNKFFCRKFTLRSSGTVELTVTKADDFYVPLRDNDDWTISLVQNEWVLYSGTVDRLDEEKVFSYELSKGNYILVIQRNTGNSGVRRINIASSFE